LNIFNLIITKPAQNVKRHYTKPLPSLLSSPITFGFFGILALDIVKIILCHYRPKRSLTEIAFGGTLLTWLVF